jgi:hypothetical protein
MIKSLYEFIFTEKMIGDYEQSRSTGLNPSYSSMSPGFSYQVRYGSDEEEDKNRPEQQVQQPE